MKFLGIADVPSLLFMSAVPGRPPGTSLSDALGAEKFPRLPNVVFPRPAASAYASNDITDPSAKRKARLSINIQHRPCSEAADCSLVKQAIRRSDGKTKSARWKVNCPQIRRIRQ